MVYGSVIASDDQEDRHHLSSIKGPRRWIVIGAIVIWASLLSAYASSEGDDAVSDAEKAPGTPIGDALLFVEPRFDRSCEGRGESNTHFVYLEVRPAKICVNGRALLTVRSFNGSVPGPTLCVAPGETLTVRIRNCLGPETQDIDAGWNQMRLPNTTSLHAHGLHVSPIGAADNVLAAVRPGDVRDYVYEVPENHPTGTYWLHAHFHGSSAYETAYSMASALLVRAKGQGVSTHVQEFVALIQNVEVGTASGSDATRLAQEIGSGLGRELARPPTAFVAVNGVRSPKLRIPARKWVRLRLIHAAVDGYLVLSFRNPEGGVPTCKVLLAASDGKDLRAPRAQDVFLVPPGGRSDLLVLCDSARADLASGLEFIRDTAKRRQVEAFLGSGTTILSSGSLLRFFVEGSKLSSPITGEPVPIFNPLSAQADEQDLRTVADVQRHTIEWTVDASNASRPKVYGINGFQFSNTSALTVRLGQVYEWRIVNRRVKGPSGRYEPASESHPFHMHTNKFQIMGARHDTQGVGAGAGLGWAYAQGEWRDTVPVPTPGVLVIRFRPLDFAGKSLAHCHILPHEDQGMMVAFEIAP